MPKVLPESEMVKAFSMIASGGIFVPNLVSEVCGSVEKEAGLSDEEALVLTDRQREVHIAAAFKLLGVRNRVGAAAVLLSKLSVGALPMTKQHVGDPTIIEQVPISAVQQ